VPAEAKVTAMVSASPGATVTHQVQRNQPDNSWRLVVQAQARPGSGPVELRAHLLLDGQPLTETWTTRWFP
jgi:glucan biosynthesis protein